MSPTKAEKRVRATHTRSEPPLTKRERFVAETAVTMMVSKFALDDHSLKKFFEIAPKAVDWFVAMKQREESRKALIDRLKTDVAIDFAKWGARAIGVGLVGWIAWSVSTKFHDFVIGVVHP